MIQEYFSALTQVKLHSTLVVASAFHQKINQKHQNMHCDELNTFRTKYRNCQLS